MNRPPEILINSGFPTDANGVLTEMVIPSSVITFNTPQKITFMGQYLNYVPSTAAVLQEFEAPNITSIIQKLFYGYNHLQKVVMTGLKTIDEPSGTTGLFCGCTALTTVIMPSLEYLRSCDGSYGNNTASGCFGNCSSLTSISFPSLKTLANLSGFGKACFMGCSALSSISMPALETIADSSNNGGGIFNGLTNLTEISFPSIKQISNARTFGNCTGLTSVTLGSVGHPVTSISNNTFYNCTQSNLTITVYTADGLPLSGSPWGATNTTPDFVQA